MSALAAQNAPIPFFDGWGDLYIPATVAVPVLVGVVLCAILAAWITAKRAAMVAARRARANPIPTPHERKAETRYLIAAFVATGVVWLAVFAMSFIGLMAFATDDMGWHSWTAAIVPISIDGIAISQGIVAYAQTKRGRSAARQLKWVLMGALFSAAINFWHGWNAWTLFAGIYLGGMSVAGMRLFHDLLLLVAEDVEENQETVTKRRKVGVPQFGERWIWAPWSTVCSRRAWIVWPPAEGVESTVTNALAHWDRYKVYKKTNRGAAKVETAAEIERRKVVARASVVQATTDLASASLPPGERRPSPHPVPPQSPLFSPGGERLLPTPGDTALPRGVEALFPPYAPQGAEELSPELVPAGARPGGGGVNGTSPQGKVNGTAPHPNALPTAPTPVAAPVRRRPAEETVRLADQYEKDNPTKSQSWIAQQLGITPKTLRDARDRAAKSNPGGSDE